MSPPPSANKRGGLCMEDAATANAMFLGNLERWIDATVECNLEINRSPEQLIEKVKESVARAIQSNIEYHKILANVYEEDEDGKSPFYLRHKLMVQIYENLLCIEQRK
jgi:hypothetical protein